MIHITFLHSYDGMACDGSCRRLFNPTADLHPPKQMQISGSVLLRAVRESRLPTPSTIGCGSLLYAQKPARLSHHATSNDHIPQIHRYFYGNTWKSGRYSITLHSFFKHYPILGKFTEYKLPLKSIAPGTHEFEYHLGKVFFENMESADIHDADLTVKLSVTYKSDIYTLAFHITGTITLICDRCLDDLIQEIDTTYNLTVRYGDDYNDDSDELLIIPASDNYLNVAYMIYDTVALTVPIKHVHPMGKCNRQMSAMLKKHRAHRPDDEDAELEDSLIDEMDSMDSEPAPTDPRWDGLKNLGGEND